MKLANKRIIKYPLPRTRGKKLADKKGKEEKKRKKPERQTD